MVQSAKEGLTGKRSNNQIEELSKTFLKSLSNNFDGSEKEFWKRIHCQCIFQRIKQSHVSSLFCSVSKRDESEKVNLASILMKQYFCAVSRVFFEA